MSKACIQEIDFFQMEKLQNPSSKPSSPASSGTSSRGIQSVVSRINPQLLKTVMAATRSSEKIPSSWSTGQPPLSSNPPSPAAPAPAPLPASCPAPDTAPLTIFYNGTVTTFDIPNKKAEAIMRMAEAGIAGDTVRWLEGSLLDGNQLEGDLPIARRKSLHRFLEKRKERLVSASPYQMGTTSRLC